MGFLGVYTAVYTYTPQSDQELAINEGDLLYIIEKSTEDDWWKAKKRAEADGDEEPVGLIPSNYIEEAKPLHHVKALYDYARQTDEEVSFSEGANLSVYDTSDPDWTLVGLNDDYGFAPANYIDTIAATAQPTPQKVSPTEARDLTTESEELPTPNSPNAHPQSPAAAIAGIIQRKTSTSASNIDLGVSSPSSAVDSPPRKPTYTPDASDDEGPPQPAPGLPERPSSEQYPPSPNHTTQYSSLRPPESPGILSSPPYIRAAHPDLHLDVSSPLPGGFHLYNISEMVYVMGKQKKMPTTLGINTATGKILVAPAKQDAPQQEWTADKLNHYSIEGKHVFIELIRPSRSLDFHAGAKDTAQEIVSALGEVAGAFRAEGLREVLEAGVVGKSQKTGKILYDFVAQGDDEVTVAVEDEVIILDSTKSEEWWQVRRVKNGREGVVPSSYVELTGVTSIPTPSTSGTTTSQPITGENRFEEGGLERGTMDSSRRKDVGDTKGPEVGPGVKLPQRGSSLLGRDGGGSATKQRNKRESRGDGKSPATSKQKPDATRTRTWTDRSGSFKVEAEFLGCRDGKIHLHKLNGVKIAVPVVKMSVEDLEYVERVTGMSLDEDKPLSDIRRQKSQLSGVHGEARATSTTIGATIDQSKKEEYDWFDFFLKCGVDVNLCQRYATNFSKDSMDESVLPDITPSVLRTLGLKEGDILRVMKYLDNRYGRVGAKAKRNVSFGGAEVMGTDEGEEGDRKASNGGLFSGPGGALRNNTRKGRPAPTVQASDVVDPKAFEQKDGGDAVKTTVASEAVATPPAPTPIQQQKDSRGFDDDAWDVKPPKQQPPPSQSQSNMSTSAPAATQTPTTQQPTLTGSLRELSILSPALQPTVVHSGGQQHPSQPPQLVQQQQPSGATPSFFSQLSQQQSGGQPQQTNLPQAPPVPNLIAQPTAFSQQQASAQFQPNTTPPAPPLPSLVSHAASYLPQQPQQSQIPRQRPQVPNITQNQGSLMPPPPPRPLSAPQNFSQPNGFSIPPIQQQLTGYQNQPSNFTSQIPPPSQNLNDPRLQSQYGGQQVQPMSTAFSQHGNGSVPQTTGFVQYGTGVFSQPTGLGQPFQQLPSQQVGIQSPQVYVNGQSTGALLGNPSRQQQSSGFQSVLSQPTGSQPSFSPSPQQQQQTSSINSFLPPALRPQPTGQTHNFGPNSGQGQFGQAMQSVPPIPKQPTLAPLQAQKTGPAPPVRFGVNAEKKLAPQPTGRRANLSQASKCLFSIVTI
ncbi:MAG: cytoskeletal protein binding protein [Trichoglossum hirsutum]|nr:MAG: cytoskeletal protein binding protein [Trichoglossum hirsutum]